MVHLHVATRATGAVLTIVALLLLGGLAGPSAASSTGPGFSGRCALTGTVTFAPALRALPAAGAQSAVLSGTCSGTLDGHSIRNLRTTYRASGSSTANSCTAGLDTGAGRITMGTTAFAFRLREARVAAVSALRIDAGSWTAIGEAALTSTDLVGILRACATAGLARVPVEAVLLSS